MQPIQHMGMAIGIGMPGQVFFVSADVKAQE